MKKNILHIQSSPRGTESSSTLLGNTIIEKLLKENPGSDVIINNVIDKNYQPLGLLHVEAYRLPDDAKSPAHKNAVKGF